MNKIISRTLLGVAALVCAQIATAVIDDTRVTPATRQILVNQDNQLSLNWQVLVSSPTVNVVSTAAVVRNPVTGVVLTTLGSPLNAVGAGPYFFPETLSITGAQAQSWLAQGIRRVIIERLFNDPAGGSTDTASMVLTLSKSTLSASRTNPTGEFSINGLRLEFESGNNLAVVKQGEDLRAKLSVIYAGTGFLEGRWQIAEPGGSDGNPVFRTLALTRTQLTAAQRSYLPSPMLTTSRSGKYLVRFCVTNRSLVDSASADPGQCPIDDLIVEAAYQVEGVDRPSIALVQNLSPNQQEINAAAAFNWGAVVGATIYQLQVFSIEARAEASVGNDASDADMVEPTFITGMVLPAATTQTQLSELVLSKLQKGRRYLWRITAHDNAGQLIGASGEASFVYGG